MSLWRKTQLIEFPKICDIRGNLSFVEGARHVPFPIRRVFWIYDVPGGETRGGHAHKKCHEVIMAAAGSFDLRLTDGKSERIITLNRSNRAVFIPTGVWVTMHNFTTGTILLALTDREYEEEDYIRDWDEYLEYMETLPAEDFPLLS